MGNPVKSTGGWDAGIITTERMSAGPHMFCDLNGNGLKLKDVKDGMWVKIKAKNTNWPGLGYEYLYRTNAGRQICEQIIEIRHLYK